MLASLRVRCRRRRKTRLAEDDCRDCFDTAVPITEGNNQPERRAVPGCERCVIHHPGKHHLWPHQSLHGFIHVMLIGRDEAAIMHTLYEPKHLCKLAELNARPL